MGIGPSVPPQIVLSFNGSFAFECRNDLVQAPGLAAYAKRLCCGEPSHCLLSQSYSVDAGIPACSDSGTGVIVLFDSFRPRRLLVLTFSARFALCSGFSSLEY